MKNKDTITVVDNRNNNKFEFKIKGSFNQMLLILLPFTQKQVCLFTILFTSTASCSSEITFIDGEKGILLHRGYKIEDLAEKSDYPEVCYLLLNGELPDVENKNSSRFLQIIQCCTIIIKIL